MKAYIITIGDELLLGQVIDTNSSWIGRHLALIGIEVQEKIAIKDDIEIIIHHLSKASEVADILLLTGGLGPTKDDITKLALSQFLGQKLVFNEDMFAHVNKYFNKMGKKPSEAIRKQCYLPEGVKMIRNKMGTAPGMQFEHGDKTIISMPGVPYEMKYIMNSFVLPALKKRSNRFIYYRTINTFGLGETRIAERIEQIENHLPPEIKLAYLPNLGGVRLRLTGSTSKTSGKTMIKTIDKLVQSITEEIGLWIYGYDHQRLIDVFMETILKKGASLALAESCTGGYVSNFITQEPGVSRFYIGSVISYDNRIKENVLNVNKSTLEKYGAVSEACVREMLTGVLDLYRADVGASISGIAGPTGGTTEKPIGTIWIAYGSRDDIKTEKLQLGKDRKLNIEYTSEAVLNMLIKFLLR